MFTRIHQGSDSAKFTEHRSSGRSMGFDSLMKRNGDGTVNQSRKEREPCRERFAFSADPCYDRSIVVLDNREVRADR